MELKLIFTIAIPSGIVSGLISPFLVSWLQHKFIWRKQREFELRNSVFRDAARSLSMLERDALDPGLQANKSQYNGITRKTEYRSETLEFYQTTRSLIQSLFSTEAFKAFDEACKTPVSIETAPDPSFDSKKNEALVKLSKEI